MIATELHKDGHPHLHIFVKYEARVTWKVDKWDIGAYHGNYQVAKCWKAVERYCKKGGDYIANINLENAVAKKNKTLLTKSIKEAVDDGDIDIMKVP